MRYMAIINSCIILVITPLIFKLIRKKQRDSVNKTNEIKQPSLYLYIGIIGIIFFDLILPILCFLEIDPSMTWDESLIFCVILSILFNLLFIYLILLSVNWKIIVNDSNCEYFNIFKKRKIFSFSEYSIHTYPSSVRIIKLIKNKKKKCFLNISNYCSNYDILSIKYREFLTKK